MRYFVQSSDVADPNHSSASRNRQDKQISLASTDCSVAYGADYTEIISSHPPRGRICTREYYAYKNV